MQHRKWQMNRAGYTALFLVLCAVGVPLVVPIDGEAQTASKSQTNGRQPMNTADKSPLLERAHRPVSEEWRQTVFTLSKGITRDQKTIGESLMKILDNEDLPPEERIRAAELLAEMRYLPAIPMLIEHITLRPRFNFESTGPLVAHALGRYGSCIILHVVEAYLNLKNDFSSASQRRQTALALAIHSANAIKAAEIYAKGLATETDDPEKQERIKKLLEYTSHYSKKLNY